jgi:hypothetical protein
MYFVYYANYAQRPKYRNCLSNSWPVYYVEIRSYDIQKFLLRTVISLGEKY